MNPGVDFYSSRAVLPTCSTALYPKHDPLKWPMGPSVARLASSRTEPFRFAGTGLGDSVGSSTEPEEVRLEV